MEPHPKGSHARILLSSVFGPYAQDDEFGSRSINPMELYHNQVTRAQGSFSLRMFHRSWGIMMIQENISAPCSVLDFPTREAFARELTTNHYDIVGISSIIVNVLKVREMCRMVRELIARFGDRGGRARRCHSRPRSDDRRRPHRARRRHLLDAPVSGRRRARAYPPPGHCFRPADTHHGHAPAASARAGRQQPSFLR